MLPKLLILITIIFFNFHYFSSSQLGAEAKCHPDDEAGLLAFKSGIKSDPSGMLLSWIPGTGCCSNSWLGIRCEESNRVTTIDLEFTEQPYNSTEILSGTISPALSKLQYLREIFLENLRNLSGPFPSFLFSLPRLETIFIVNNNLSGQLPKNIGKLSSKLGGFNVEGNLFSGTIPSSLGQLTQLTMLKLGGNMFTGSIPYTIGNLTKLSWLSFDRNELTGTIPDFFKGLTNLNVFNVSHNKLSGNIPGSITAASNTLYYLQAGHNSLTGKIPEFLGRLQELDTLDLSWNQFQGTVPKSFTNLTRISNLDLSYNSLVDPFPKLDSDLNSIDLSYNHFHLGHMPAWGSSSQIRSIKLAKCGIKIKLDDWKPFFIQLFIYIDLSENEIRGSPVQLLNDTRDLEGFNASGNKLKFNLESMIFKPALKNLDLSRNLVFGKVPAEAFSGLEMLNVSNNHLCGQLPKTKFPATSFLGNDCLCGAPLPQCKD